MSKYLLYGAAELISENKMVFGYDPKCNNKYVRQISVKIYAVPYQNDEDDDSDAFESVFSGESTDTEINIAALTGQLILGREMNADGDYILYDVCDAESGDLEYVASALEEVYEYPCSPITENNFLYIQSVKIADEFRDYAEEIFENLPAIIQKGTNAFPDIMLYYPEPVKYEQNIFFKIRHDMAGIAFREIMDDAAENTTDSEVKLTMDEDQINHILGRRVKDETYPESAKNRVEWDLFESLGFREFNDSRLLMKQIWR